MLIKLTNLFLAAFKGMLDMLGLGTLGRAQNTVIKCTSVLACYSKSVRFGGVGGRGEEEGLLIDYCLK